MLQAANKAHLSPAAVQAGQVAEALRHTAQQVGDQAVVARKSTRHDVTVHDHVADGAAGKAQARHQAIARHWHAVRIRLLQTGHGS